MLVLQRKLGDGLILNDNIEISIIEINKDKVKIGINAPKTIKILRKEIVEIQKQNKEALNTVNYNVLRSFAQQFTEGKQNDK